MSVRKAAEASGGETGSKHAPFSGLVVVATPIGNLEDLGARAARALRTADVVACEDTRTSGRLLAHLGAATPRVAYHEHNAERMRPILMKRLKAGETVALVSDAGTPLISDPGFKLVRACFQAGIVVTTVPGPSAVLAALVLAGLPTDRFYFGGFLPPKSAARRRSLEEVAALQATLLFFESAQRLPASLADMAASLGDRPAAVAREMTKLYEEVRRDGLAALAAHYAGAGPPKGEVVVVVAPPAAAETPSEETLDTRLKALLDRGVSVRDAAATVASETGAPRRALYARALALGRDDD
ncbi:MAG: 16S rRNA (cytidine(1402)-2'-O)-methyltransferase [Acetobacterales bacterium]